MSELSVAQALTGFTSGLDENAKKDARNQLIAKSIELYLSATLNELATSIEYAATDISILVAKASAGSEAARVGRARLQCAA